MQFLVGSVACTCMGAAMCGAGINYAVYALILSFFTVFGFEEMQG